jgi:hypothetical protein
MGRRQGARRAHPAPLFYSPGTLGLQGSMKVVRDVTDEQRGSRPIFIATLWAAAGWLFFRVARSSRPAPFLRWGERPKSAGLQKWCGMLVVTAASSGYQHS